MTFQKGHQITKGRSYPIELYPHHGNRGRKFTQLHINNISKSTKGISKPKGFGKKISKALKNKPKSQLHRQHMSIAQRRRWENVR